ncbi:ATP-binding cassette domain-containing protein [Paralimibaculum aggregatum]|uniref:ATP-binding cassette domain-containing protein n=1 Tax=Paralimibaculum aggregatum TaxID=3036245 RepID=A0ABQ6LPC3_9RHOB|nr:ABC transporter ATP-binding protein [Limibaculum sp. NKW23]GMG82703.1 ATP-binding cassette domain-containing protein [Limibaculum sp. NKW23]
MLAIEDLRTPLIGPVSLAVERGQISALLGPSGSGKSLILRAIVDLDPNEGTVTLDVQERASMPAPEWRRRVALVPAESGWWADRVCDHFDAESELAGLLEAVELPEALDWYVARLSSGERHRLAIVRALANRPDALLLDEPTATLDEHATGLVEALIRDQCERGVAVLLVTHDEAQPARLSAGRHRVERGRLVSLPGVAL